MTSKFIWADLSTFDIQSAKRFYNQCFGWEYQALDDGYLSCLVQDSPTAGLYTMPEKFQGMGMPSFWMSYVHVDDLEKIVRLAEQHGAKVEINPQPAPGGGMVALIRDPAGAGFTCYEGEDPGDREEGGTPGRMVWNELHVSNLARPAMLAYDSQDAAFYIMEEKHHPHRTDGDAKTRNHKRRAIAGLFIVALAVLTETNWIWGLLFLIWVVPDIQRGSTHFLEHVERRSNPVVYWLIITTWLILSVYLLAEVVQGT